MYVTKLFTPDEVFQIRMKLHWIKYIWTIFFFLLAFSIYDSGQGHELGWLALLFVAIGGYFWLKNKTTEMVVTNHRVISKTGIIAVHLGELRNVKIETIRLHQSILGRILGYGNIELTGTGNSFIVFEYVANPAIYMSQIKSIIDKCKEGSSNLL